MVVVAFAKNRTELNLREMAVGIKSLSKESFFSVDFIDAFSYFVKRDRPGDGSRL